MVAIQEANTATSHHHVNHLSHLDTKKVPHLDLGNVVYNELLKIVSLMYSKPRTCRCIHCIAGSQRNNSWVLAPCACPARRPLSASLTGYMGVALTIMTPVKLSFTQDASFHPTGSRSSLSPCRYAPTLLGLRCSIWGCETDVQF